jgi:malate/lactate dehydrogenase
VYSNGNPYGVAEDLIFSFPIRNGVDGNWEIIAGLSLSDYAKGKIAATEKELQEEKADVKSSFTF